VQTLDPAAQLVERGRHYWLQLTPRKLERLVLMVVGLVTTVSGWLGVIAGNGVAGASRQIGQQRLATVDRYPVLDQSSCLFVNRSR